MPLRVLSSMVMFASLLSATIDVPHDEFVRWTEARLLLQRNTLTQSSYEALLRQNEQVMMLRHDIVKHLRLLRQFTTDEKTASYLDELIGENEKIHSMIQSGNEMMNMILNSKLNAASAAGITVDLVRTQAPDTLPLSDTELCSLMMNPLDNALEAAASPNVKRKYIKLNMHIQNSFFCFLLRKRRNIGLDQQRILSETRIRVESSPPDPGVSWKPCPNGIRQRSL